MIRHVFDPFPDLRRCAETQIFPGQIKLRLPSRGKALHPRFIAQLIRRPRHLPHRPRRSQTEPTRVSSAIKTLCTATNHVLLGTRNGCHGVKAGIGTSFGRALEFGKVIEERDKSSA